MRPCSSSIAITHCTLAILLGVFLGCSERDGQEAPTGSGDGSAGRNGDGGEAGEMGQAGEGGTSGEGGRAGNNTAGNNTAGATAGTGGSGQGGAAQPNLVVRLPFDDPRELTDNFTIAGGSATAARVENGALVLAYAAPRTFIFDRMPDNTPTTSLDVPLTISFRFKANTTDHVPLRGISRRGDTGNPRVWVAFYGDSERRNAARVSLRWSEVDEDIVRFESGVDLGQSAFNAMATPDKTIFEWLPMWNGDVFYTMKVVLTRTQAGQLRAAVEISQDGHVQFRRSHIFANHSLGAGEIAIGGDTGRGVMTNPLIIDDLEIRRGADEIPDEVFHTTTVGGLLANLYLPPNHATVRGILLHSPGSGGTTTYLVEQEATRAFARLHGFAAVGYTHPMPADSIDTMFSLFARDTNHPELTTVPVVMYGFSAGSNSVITYASSHTDRVIAMVPDASASPTSLSAGARQIPSLFMLGENEGNPATMQAAMQTTRAQNGNVAFLLKQGIGHTPLGTLTIYLPYFERALNRRFANYRMPLSAATNTGAWLLDNATWAPLGVTAVNPAARISAYADYAGDRNAASWFIDEDSAMLASAFVTFGKGAAIAPPPHGKAGETRLITLRVHQDLANYTAVRLYDYRTPLAVFLPGAPLQFLWENIPAGTHALIARVIHNEKEYTSFPVTLIMEP